MNSFLVLVSQAQAIVVHQVREIGGLALGSVLVPARVFLSLFIGHCCFAWSGDWGSCIGFCPIFRCGGVLSLLFIDRGSCVDETAILLWMERLSVFSRIGRAQLSLVMSCCSCRDVPLLFLCCFLLIGLLLLFFWVWCFGV